MLPDVDYKTATTRKRIRQKVPGDGDTPEVYLIVRDKFPITTFYTIVGKLATEMKRRGEIYKERAERFSFLSDAPYNVNSSSTNTERGKNVKTRFSRVELYQITLEDNMECAFPNIDIAFRIFLTLMLN